VASGILQLFHGITCCSEKRHSPVVPRVGQHLVTLISSKNESYVGICPGEESAYPTASITYPMLTIPTPCVRRLRRGESSQASAYKLRTADH